MITLVMNEAILPNLKSTNTPQIIGKIGITINLCCHIFISIPPCFIELHYLTAENTNKTVHGL